MQRRAPYRGMPWHRLAAPWHRLIASAGLGYSTQTGKPRSPTRTPPPTRGQLLFPGAVETVWRLDPLPHTLCLNPSYLTSFQLKHPLPRLPNAYDNTWLDEQSSSSRTSKELEQANSELGEERCARQRVSEELCKVESEVAELRSEETRVKV